MRDRRTRSRTEEKKTTINLGYLGRAFWVAIFTIPLTRWLAPDLIPLNMYDIWNTHDTSLQDWLTAGTPVFLWGFIATILILVIKNKAPGERKDPAKMFWGGLLISLWAGITEEIAYRWLIFFGSFAWIAISNCMFFGYFGFGIPEWFHWNLWAPLANGTTFGYLEAELSMTWVTGSAILSSNAFFRNGHMYQGPIGWVNSWFLGMFFFYIMFNFGLGAAIVLHILYDIVVFWTAAAYIALQNLIDGPRNPYSHF